VYGSRKAAGAIEVAKSRSEDAVRRCKLARSSFVEQQLEAVAHDARKHTPRPRTSFAMGAPERGVAHRNDVLIRTGFDDGVDRIQVLSFIRWRRSHHSQRSAVVRTPRVCNGAQDVHLISVADERTGHVQRVRVILVEKEDARRGHGC